MVVHRVDLQGFGNFLAEGGLTNPYEPLRFCGSKRGYVLPLKTGESGRGGALRDGKSRGSLKSLSAKNLLNLNSTSAKNLLNP